MIRFAVLTVSDKGARGMRYDESGKIIKKILISHKAEQTSYHCIPDEQEKITELLCQIADDGKTDLILTTGGTGFAERDVTPEATMEVIEKEVPGIPEYIRHKTSQFTKYAVLSRARAGIRNSTLIINLPGSPKAVREYLACILDIIPHGIEILKGEFKEH